MSYQDCVSSDSTVETITKTTQNYNPLPGAHAEAPKSYGFDQRTDLKPLVNGMVEEPSPPSINSSSTHLFSSSWPQSVRASNPHQSFVEFTLQILQVPFGTLCSWCVSTAASLYLFGQENMLDESAYHVMTKITRWLQHCTLCRDRLCSLLRKIHSDAKIGTHCDSLSSTHLWCGCLQHCKDLYFAQNWKHLKCIAVLNRAPRYFLKHMIPIVLNALSQNVAPTCKPLLLFCHHYHCSASPPVQGVLHLTHVRSAVRPRADCGDREILANMSRAMGETRANPDESHLIQSPNIPCIASFLHQYDTASTIQTSILFDDTSVVQTDVGQNRRSNEDWIFLQGAVPYGHNHFTVLCRMFLFLPHDRDWCRSELRGVPHSCRIHSPVYSQHSREVSAKAPTVHGYSQCTKSMSEWIAQQVMLGVARHPVHTAQEPHCVHDVAKEWDEMDCTVLTQGCPGESSFAPLTWWSHRVRPYERTAAMRCHRFIRAVRTVLLLLLRERVMREFKQSALCTSGAILRPGEDTVASVVRHPRSCVFLGGGVASGKTSAVNELWSHCVLEGEVLPNRSDWVHIEADFFKALDPSRGVVQLGLLHQSSVDDASDLFAQAVSLGKDIFFTGTMQWQPYVEHCLTVVRTFPDQPYQAVRDPTLQSKDIYFLPSETSQSSREETAKANPCYRLVLVGITVDPRVALQRALLRYVRTGREVPIVSLLESHQRFSMHFLSYVDQFDTVLLYDNNEPVREQAFDTWQDTKTATALPSRMMPRIIAEKRKKGHPLKVHDVEAYEKFLSYRNINTDATCAEDLFRSSGTES